MTYRTTTKAGPSIQRGTGVVTITASQVGTLNVSFDTPFAVAPVVITTADDSAYFATAQLTTTTGFRITARHYQATSATIAVNVNWIAVL